MNADDLDRDLESLSEEQLILVLKHNKGEIREILKRKKDLLKKLKTDE